MGCSKETALTWGVSGSGGPAAMRGPGASQAHPGRVSKHTHRFGATEATQRSNADRPGRNVRGVSRLRSRRRLTIHVDLLQAEREGEQCPGRHRSDPVRLRLTCRLLVVGDRHAGQASAIHQNDRLGLARCLVAESPRLANSSRRRRIASCSAPASARQGAYPSFTSCSPRSSDTQPLAWRTEYIDT